MCRNSKSKQNAVVSQDQYSYTTHVKKCSQGFGLFLCMYTHIFASSVPSLFFLLFLILLNGISFKKIKIQIKTYFDFRFNSLTHFCIVLCIHLNPSKTMKKKTYFATYCVYGRCVWLELISLILRAGKSTAIQGILSSSVNLYIFCWVREFPLINRTRKIKIWCSNFVICT